MLPEPVKKFADVFSKLPGIGPRQATRLAFYIKNSGTPVIQELSQAINNLSLIKTCSLCFSSYHNIKTENGLCGICLNPHRKRDIVAVVEKETDLMSLERTGKFTGRYLVLGDLRKDGALNQMQKMRLQTIKNAEEVILAMSPTSYGDFNATVVAQELKDSVKRMTRLGRGIPTGGEIEFADEDTLGSALDNRK